MRGDAQTVARLAADKHLALAGGRSAARRRRHLVQPRGRPRRGRDPAALRLYRAIRVPGHGHPQRRSRHPGGAAQRRGRWVPARSCCARATRCCCRGPGRRSTSGWSRRTCWSSIRPSWCADRPFPWARAPSRRWPCWPPWCCCWPPGWCPRRWPGLLAAGAMILLGIVSVEQSYRAINWTTIIMIGAMMPLSTAMYQSGAAAMLGEIAGAAGRRCRPLRAAGRPVPADRDPGPADQQHGDRPDHHPDRGRRRDASSASRRSRC